LARGVKQTGEWGVKQKDVNQTGVKQGLGVFRLGYFPLANERYLKLST